MCAACGTIVARNAPMGPDAEKAAELLDDVAGRGRELVAARAQEEGTTAELAAGSRRARR